MRPRHLVLLCAICLAACSAPSGLDIKQRFTTAERALDTDGSTTNLFHPVLYYPLELRLQFDGYIVGVEKSPRDRIWAEGDLRFNDLPAAGLGDQKAREWFDDGKLLYVSHIMESTGGVRNGLTCTLYNLYAIDSAPQFAPACAEAEPAPSNYQGAYLKSWEALGTLKKEIKKKVESRHYTDLVVVTMGWNTAQEEAIRNFNSIVNSLGKAAGGDRFEPLVIGVSWPSMWASAWVDPLFKGVSFKYKAEDADELGLGWLAVILHDTIAPARANKLPITVIGHSFGARASSTAACVGPAIQSPLHHPKLASIDNLINLQGAFLSDRLFGADDDGFHYPVGCLNVSNLVLTSSVNDTAMNKPFWGLYVGDDRSYEQQCGLKGRQLRCAVADKQGTLIGDGANPNSNILYINADALIHENAFNTGGGAHSDIYRPEMGKLIYHLTRPRAVQP